MLLVGTHKCCSSHSITTALLTLSVLNGIHYAVLVAHSYVPVVREKGLEPSRLTAADFESASSANSNTPAYNVLKITNRSHVSRFNLTQHPMGCTILYNGVGPPGVPILNEHYCCPSHMHMIKTDANSDSPSNMRVGKTTI